ncbi:unnamed protein product [Heligmosomoides polygyrus]|uniref:DUF3715 domain-containing protein n=1 Tax=Heligmosomoides polygyrus TaxID=6339 RepID=A0A3P8B2S5_HELPZ|nr:unnamed protein product [Heligmosomoides polygyrus]
MNFVIPKKKRVLEKPEIDISSLEPKATIEDAPRDSPKFNTVKNIVLESVSDRQVNQFMQVEKVQLIKNQFLEYKYSQFKVNLRSSGQSDAESYGFVLIGFDDEDCNYIADNGYSVGTSFYGDLGLSPRGEFHAMFAHCAILRLYFRGKSYAVGLGSTELEPTLDCSSHIAASDHIPNAKKNRQQLYRQSAVYHYEYNKDMTLSEVPSGVLPYAVVDIRFSVSDRNQHSNLLPTYVSDQLYFYSVYEGPLTICSATFGKATLNTIFEESNKPHGLDESLIFTKFLKWADAYDVRGVAQLMAPETWGLVMKHREVCVKNHNERFEKWKVRFVSHFVWTCNEPRFATIVNAMRVEQCAAIAYSIDATTYVAFPSSQFSSVFGLPWLHTPSLHVLVIHANPLFYADSTDVNCSNEETEIISKIPLGTAILDGDDATVCSSFESQVQAKAPAQPDMRGNATRSSLDEPLPQSSERASKPSDSSQSPPAEAESEPAAPLPPVPLPPFAGKSCLRNKPPQVFVEQPPLIGKSVPPPAPGVARSNENKCGKKLSNDRDEALKAGLHGRALPPKDLLMSKPTASTTARGAVKTSSLQSIPARSPNHDTSSSPPVIISKNKDLFQGVFNTIKKGNSTDVEAGGKSLSNVPLSDRTETSKGYSMPRRLGQTKNCIITSLPLPLLSRNLDNGNRDLSMSSPVASATAQSSEDELMICDMEIESGSEETPTPPNVKPSPDGVDETADIIDDHDEDYDAQFMCETTSSMDSQSSSPPAPTTIPLDKTGDEATAATSNSKIVGEKSALNGNNMASSETAVPSTSESKDPINGTSTAETEAPASPPPPSVSAILLELLRANQSQSQPKPQCQDTDLRRMPSTASKDPAPTSDDNHMTRKSRFDQPPPELADAGFLPKPVPTASVGFVGNVPALGASVMDTDLRSTPPATLAFSIKKATTAPALNPPAPLIFGDDEDDDDESEDVRSRQRSERKDRDDRKDRDERVKRWGKAESIPSCDNTRPPSIPTSAPPAISPNIAGVQKEKAADNSKLFHILSGARLLQSQRDKKVAEQEPPSTHTLPVSQSELNSEASELFQGFRNCWNVA